MNSQKKGFITHVILIFIAVILIGGSFYLYSKRDNTNLSIEDKLFLAKTKVENETLKLENLKKRYGEETKTINKIQADYKNIKENILKKTDVFFDNANSDNPKIKIKINDKKIEDEINNKRLNITKLLSQWDEKMEIISLSTTSPELLPTLLDLVKSARDDMNYIQDYIFDLSSVITNLSSEDSSLTEKQIYSYVAIIEENSQKVNELVSTIEVIVVDTQKIYEPNNLLTTEEIPVVQINNNQNNPVSTNIEVHPIVTTSQIEAQELVVDEAVAEQTEIEQELISTQEPIINQPIIYNQIYIQPSYGYLPPTSVDYSGWPDISPDSSLEKPILLQGN